MWPATALLPRPERLTAASGDGEISITLHKTGEDLYQKSRHPTRYGIYSEIETPEAVFQFNLNQEIVGTRGKTSHWPSPSEWLKRTVGNDWVYYSTGGYAGTYETLGEDTLAQPIRFRIPSPYNEVYKATGEYYLPNLPYESNAVLGVDPFQVPAVQHLVTCWFREVGRALDRIGKLPEPFCEFARRVRGNTPEKLRRKAQTLFSLYGSRPTVLPPGTRHVDYNVIPLSVTTGCLYKCGFCQVKNRLPCTARTVPQIEAQLEALKAHYGQDLVNYNAVFLGDHDALHAGTEILLHAAHRALGELDLRHSYMNGCRMQAICNQCHSDTCTRMNELSGQFFPDSLHPLRAES